MTGRNPYGIIIAEAIIILKMHHFLALDRATENDVQNYTIPLTLHGIIIAKAIIIPKMHHFLALDRAAENDAQYYTIPLALHSIVIAKANIIINIRFSMEVQTLRIVFCDDNAPAAEQLQEMVLSYFRQIGAKAPDSAVYTSGEDMLASEHRADIAFLDVQMPGVSGIQAGAILKERNPCIKIIITTSHSDYLDEAMRFQVFRYLSKPIDQSRLFRSLKDALYQYNMDTKKYPISTADGIFVRRAEEIVCVETNFRRTRVYTIHEILECKDNMDHWRQTLTLPCFYQPHRSFIVNMRFVNRITTDDILLKYQSKEKTAYLSSRKSSDFKKTYLIYLESTKQ